MCAHIYILCVDMYLCTSIYIYISYIYIYTYTCTHICIYIYVYIYILLLYFLVIFGVWYNIIIYNNNIYYIYRKSY